MEALIVLTKIAILFGSMVGGLITLIFGIYFWRWWKYYRTRKNRAQETRFCSCCCVIAFITSVMCFVAIPLLLRVV